MEIQSVLSPGSQSTISNGGRNQSNSNNQSNSVNNQSKQNESITLTPLMPQATLSAESMKDIASVFTKSLVHVLKDCGIARSEHSDHDSEYYSESEADNGQGIEVLRELPTGKPCQINNTVPMFGVDINEDPVTQRVTVADIHRPSSSVDPNPSPVVPNPSPALAPNPPPVLAPSPPVVVSDKSLPPVISTRAPTNWFPDPEVLAWASEMADKSEWTSDDRDIIKKQFSPEPIHDHLFTAVSPPVGMLSAIQSSEIKRKDFLFRRADTEEFLLEANKDLVCGFRPLIEVLSNMKNDPSQANNRTLLARVFQCMASSASHISRGRRELGRRFVNFTNMEALYKTKPSHYTFFGDSSVDSAVTKAVAQSKINKDLIVLPKKRKYPSRSYHPGSKQVYLRDGSQSFHNNNFTNYRSGKFHRGRRGRGRSNRRGKPQQITTSNSKTATQN